MVVDKDPVALLVIDMQQGMSGMASGERNNPSAESNIENLLAAWRRNRLPIIHIRHISRTPESPFWPGQPGVEFQLHFLPLAGEHIVEKNVPDAFVCSGLERWLHVRDIRQIVIVGVSTNNSIEATARTAGCLGFKVHVVEDGTFAFPKRDFSGVQRSASEVHAMSLANLDGEYASILSAAQALKMF
ncbi:cysteine hydrolase family protein [Halomonas caseinilytica]|uniref:Nicotinamidase-related amidase n=1 Tax=Halomonas caseinilytica TaxID=438744 RepID=A0A1M6NCJ6_9GAMM|nr:cysteine hydrolase family protein [Halomonas caseinilytica]SHJ93440.1 Nicotinamidase-related amidase [Halomonas caseinilytica]